MFDLLKALIILAILVVLVFMLLDVLKRTFPRPIHKVLWFLALTFLPVIGMACYYYLVMRVKEEQEGLLE